MVDAAYQYSIIREYTTCKEATIRSSSRTIQFHNTNHLIGNPRWQIGLSKTGFIDEPAGAWYAVTLAKRPVLIVLLDSQGKLTRYGMPIASNNGWKVHIWCGKNIEAEDC